jgi:protein phosphatase
VPGLEIGEFRRDATRLCGGFELPGPSFALILASAFFDCPRGAATMIPSTVSRADPFLDVHTGESAEKPNESIRSNPLGVRAYGLTDCGRVRDSNEDQFAFVELVKVLQIRMSSLPQPTVKRSQDKSYLFIVADGMGGKAAGETASALAVESVESFVLESLKWFAHCQGGDDDKILAEFQKSLEQASLRVKAESENRPELHGMGTTLTLAYSLNDELFIAHAGDSRCYMCREGSLFRATRDHTLVEELVKHGQISADEAKSHRWRHVITNALGGEDFTTNVEVHKLHLQDGDCILLCSDGLTEMLSDEQISQIILASTDPEQACRQLVDRANAEGGKDNITVVIARFESARGAKPAETK